jgi:hypothetical protein
MVCVYVCLMCMICTYVCIICMYDVYDLWVSIRVQEDGYAHNVFPVAVTRGHDGISLGDGA